jgi:hypothetical protein
MRELTLKTLIAKGACKDQVDLFVAAFGDSVDVTVALCVKHAGQFKWDWAARNLLSEVGRADYDRDTAVARAGYYHDIAEALAEYERVMAPALAEYGLAVRGPAVAEYNRDITSAGAEYDHATAEAFAALYIQEVMTDA